MSKARKNQAKPFTTYQHMLRERLRSCIDTLHTPLKSDVEAALEQRGKLLCPSLDSESLSRPNGMWALLPLVIIRNLCPDNDLSAAYNVALSVECLICSLDLLDDIEDGDQTPIVRQLGAARVLNVSTALLLLSQKMLRSLADFGISADRIVTLMALTQEAVAIAIIGQHEDIVGEQQEIDLYTTEDCIRIARGKAGALLRLACTIGCMFVNTDQHIQQLFAELGELLGIAHQFDNDSHDLYTILHDQETETVKTDIAHQKKTLPLVLAAQIRASQHTAPNISQRDETDPQHALLASYDEGIIAAWGISLLYRERAQDCLRAIEVRQPVSGELRLLLGFA